MCLYTEIDIMTPSYCQTLPVSATCNIPVVATSFQFHGVVLAALFQQWRMDYIPLSTWCMGNWSYISCHRSTGHCPIIIPIVQCDIQYLYICERYGKEFQPLLPSQELKPKSLKGPRLCTNNVVSNSMFLTPVTIDKINVEVCQCLLY